MTGNNKDNIALLRMTEDRDRWRIMIADVCSRQGIWDRQQTIVDIEFLAEPFKNWLVWIYKKKNDFQKGRETSGTPLTSK